MLFVAAVYLYPLPEKDALDLYTGTENTYGRMSKAQFLARYHCVVDKFQPIGGKQTTVPLLIIESDNDPLVAAELRAKPKQYYTVAQVHTFHEKGHFPYLNDPKEFNTVLKTFLSK